MGGSNGKQNVEKGNNKRRPSIRKVLRFQSRRASKPARPVSYAGIDQHHGVHETSARPLSMFDVVPFHKLETSEIIYLINILEKLFFDFYNQSNV